MFLIMGLQLAARTTVAILGSGNPNPDPKHSGCSVAIIVGKVPYIVDFGPGLIRKAAALSPRYGGEIEALKISNIRRAFLTHLHSDHTIGYPDLILTPWVMGRSRPLKVYGPKGLKKMTDLILEAYIPDIRYRLYGQEPANNQGWQVIVHEIEPGLIYRDKRVRVEAFRVKHGSWPNAFGFRFTTSDKTIVISGDTAPCQNILKYGKNADILIHEVYYKKAFDQKPPAWQRYHKSHHTSTEELGKIAAAVQPKLLVLYHTLFWGASESDLIKEVRRYYQGALDVASDLEIYRL